MSLFYKNNSAIYHVHIPRTGGRFITQTLVSNDYEVANHTCDDDVILYGIECYHLHYPLYEYFEDVSSSLQFAVCRNPITRFWSEFSTVAIKRSYTQKDIEPLDDYDNFCYWINYERMVHHYAKNWFRPQHEFVSDKTIIWKFEDGLCKPFRNWFFDLTGDRLEDKEYSYYGDEDNELNPKRKEFTLSKSIMDNVCKYYQEDFNRFNYNE